MNEPANHEAVVDRDGDTLIRVDEHPGTWGNWWPITDGPTWGGAARNRVGVAHGWTRVEAYGVQGLADAARTARALARVRQEWAR